jgi:hypothetical protein
LGTLHIVQAATHKPISLRSVLKRVLDLFLISNAIEDAVNETASAICMAVPQKILSDDDQSSHGCNNERPPCRACTCKRAGLRSVYIGQS